jgi:uncharacterized protein DUF2490
VKKFFVILFLLILASCIKAHAQNVNFPGISPSASVRSALNSKIDINFLATSKIRFGERTIKEETYLSQILEIYAQALLNYSLNKNWHIGIGYGFQRNNPFLDNWRNEHRFVQQAIYVMHLKHSMLYNRLRFEERVFSFPKSAHQFGARIRYQLGFATPLTSRIYWQINEEAYVIPSSYRNAFFSENWIYSGIGFKAKYFGSFETGFGYNSIARNSTGDYTNYFLVQVAWSYMIKSRDKDIMDPIMHDRHF